MNHSFFISFLPRLKNKLVKTFVIYVIDFDFIGISTHLAPQNDSQRLDFVKDIYVVGKKWPEMVVNWPNAKVVSFLNGQSLYIINLLL